MLIWTIMIVFLGIGSNLGDKQANIRKACNLIDSKVGKVIAESSVYKSAPWGFKSVNAFYNIVIGINTFLSPSELLSFIKETEREMGRSFAGIGYSDRIIDIDILLIDNSVISQADLVIPHALLHKRLFVLLPLAEIAASHIHPVLQKTIEQLLEECNDDSSVELISLPL